MWPKMQVLLFVVGLIMLLGVFAETDSSEITEETRGFWIKGNFCLRNRCVPGGRKCCNGMPCQCLGEVCRCPRKLIGKLSALRKHT
uniref:Toxin 18 isoform a S1 n=1 Tax=Cupiennius salei TaxID=6928 RepID=A0A4Y5UGM3_CUPSA|nr:toxin 18 isoform a S1 precursor [Cupiennius salei]QDC23124.1 toxin 18 isoform a S2 precursor [Cupiennius salei]